MTNLVPVPKPDLSQDAEPTTIPRIPLLNPFEVPRIVAEWEAKVAERNKSVPRKPDPASST